MANGKGDDMEVKALCLDTGQEVSLEVTEWEAVALYWRVGKANENHVARVRIDRDQYYEDDNLDTIGERVWKKLHRLAKIPYPYPGLFGGLRVLSGPIAYKGE